MSVLELARKALARLKAQRNGHLEAPSCLRPAYEINEKSPPPTSSPVHLLVQDEQAQAEQAKTWLVQTMLDGMGRLIHPVPVEVEAKIARSWSE